MSNYQFLSLPFKLLHFEMKFFALVDDRASGGIFFLEK